MTLHALFARDPAVRAVYLVEMHRGADLSDVSLLLNSVVTEGSEERLVQLTSLELNSLSPAPSLAVTMCCQSPMNRFRVTANTVSSSMEPEERGALRIAAHAHWPEALGLRVT